MVVNLIIVFANACLIRRVLPEGVVRSIILIVAGMVLLQWLSVLVMMYVSLVIIKQRILQGEWWII